MRRVPTTRAFIARTASALLFLAAAAAQAQQSTPVFFKVFQPDTIGSGSASTLVFTIDNAENPQPVTGLAFTDPLPAGVTIADPGSPVSTCGGTLSAPAGGGTITFSGGQVGAFESCEIRVDVTSATLGIHTNVSGDLTSSAGNSGAATDDLEVAADRPGFSKGFSPSTVQLGADSTLTFTIDNSLNESAAFNLFFTDNLPAGLVVDGPSNATTTCGGSLSASPGGNQVSLALGNVAALDTCTVSVDVTAGAVGSLVNRSGELTSTPGGPSVSSGKAVAALQVNADDLALRKSFTDDPATPGGTANLRFTLSNLNRDSTATGITFSDDLDATLSGLVAVPPLPTEPCGAGSTLSGTSLLTLTGGNLGPGETCSFDVTVQVPASATPGTYPNTTSQVSGDLDGTPVTGAAAQDDLFVDIAPTLTKSFLSSTAGSGGTVDVEFTITNTSSSSGATDIAFTDDLTAFLTGTTTVGLPMSACGGTVNETTGSFGETLLRLQSGSLGPGASCSFTVTLQLADGAPAGTHTNTTSEITATVDGSTRTGAPASDTLDVVAPPRLNKAFTDDPVDPGATVTLEFTLSHDELAPGDATDIAFTDDLEATLTGLTAIALPADGFCGPGSQMTGTNLLTVTGAGLDPGTSCSFQVTLQVPAGAAPGSHTNTTSPVTATVDGLAATGNTASDDLQVSGLNLTKAFVGDPVLPGGTVILRFTIDNVHPSLDATDISFTDDLDDALPGLAATGLPMNDVCGTGSSVSGTSNLTFSGGTLPAGGSCTFDVTVQVPAGAASATYPNFTSPLVGTLDGQVITFGNASDNLVVDANLLDLSKAFTDDPVQPGDTVTLEFTITNLSSADTIDGIAFTDDLEGTLSGLVSESGTQNDVCGSGSQLDGTSVLSLTGGTLGPGASCTFSATLRVPDLVPSGGSFTNVTSAPTGSAGGLAVEGAPASDDLRVNVASLSKAFLGPAAAGGSVVLEFSIVNNNPDATSGLAFTDDLDATLPGLVAAGLPTSDVCGPGSELSGTSLLTFSGGSLAGGASCTFSVTLQVPVDAAPGAYPNTTSDLTSAGLVIATPGTDNLAIEPPPAFSKAFSPGAVGVGDVSTLTFTIDNSASGLAATNLGFTDNLPAGMEVANPANGSTTCTGGTLSAAAGSATIQYTGGTVGAGAICTVQADVIATAAGDLANTSGDLTSSLGNSGTASATLEVAAPLEIAKSFAPDNVAGGDTSTLTFTIDNTDSSPAADVTFTDDLEAALPGLAAAGLPAADVCGAGSQVTGTGVISLTGGTIPGGGSCTFDVMVQVPADAAAGDYVNTTSAVTGTVGGTPVTGSIASDTLTVAPAPIFTKSFQETSIGLNAPTTLVFTIDNSASSLPADNLAFTDDLPLGMTVAASPNASSTCDGTVDAPPGAFSIGFSGGTVAAGAVCTIQVDVAVHRPGTYDNVTESLTSTLGNSGAAAASVQAQRITPIPALGPAALAIAALLLSLVGMGTARSRARE